jgi:hypothetical protein
MRFLHPYESLSQETELKLSLKDSGDTVSCATGKM